MWLKQYESSELPHPNKLSGSPVKYLVWALGGKMSKHYACESCGGNGEENRGEMERTDKLTKRSISILKPAGIWKERK